jgi:predicted transcriptional regulator of viral defense system
MVVLGATENAERALTRADIRLRLNQHAASVDQVIHSLRRKGWLERTGWGRYLLVPPERGPELIGESNTLALAAHLTNPYYIGYATAAAYYGFTPQNRRVIWLATPRAVRPRELDRVTIRVARLPAYKFFGYRAVRVFGVPVQMSNVEKTVIDCVDALERAGGAGEVLRILAGAGPRLNWKRMVVYARRMRSVALVQRLGYLTDTSGMSIPAEARAALKAVLKRGSRSVFGPHPRPGDRPRYNAEWQLFINVPTYELNAEVSNFSLAGQSASLTRGDKHQSKR